MEMSGSIGCGSPIVAIAFGFRRGFRPAMSGTRSRAADARKLVAYTIRIVQELDAIALPAG
jgi:hypothetical protein